MGNCYGLLPLQTCQKRSAPCKRPEVRFRALSGRRMECQADGLQRAPVEPSSGHRGMHRSGLGRLNPSGDLGNGLLLDANEAVPILASTLITDGVGAAMDYRQLFDRRPRQPSQNGGRIAGLAVFAAVPGMVVDQPGTCMACRSSVGTAPGVLLRTTLEVSPSPAIAGSLT